MIKERDPDMDNRYSVKPFDWEQVAGLYWLVAEGGKTRNKIFVLPPLYGKKGKVKYIKV